MRNHQKYLLQDFIIKLAPTKLKLVAVYIMEEMVLSIQLWIFAILFTEMEKSLKHNELLSSFASWMCLTADSLQSWKR